MDILSSSPQPQYAIPAGSETSKGRMMEDWWVDLSDDELKARLIQHGWPEDTAQAAVNHRDVLREKIHEEIGDGFYDGTV